MTSTLGIAIPLVARRLAAQDNIDRLDVVNLLDGMLAVQGSSYGDIVLSALRRDDDPETSLDALVRMALEIGSEHGFSAPVWAQEDDRWVMTDGGVPVHTLSNESVFNNEMDRQRIALRYVTERDKWAREFESGLVWDMVVDDLVLRDADFEAQWFQSPTRRLWWNP